MHSAQNISTKNSINNSMNNSMNESVYFYISSEGFVRSPKLTCPKDIWKTVRYNLETSNGQFVNNRTYLKGYCPIESTELPNMQEQLNESQIVPDLFFVHRLPLLPGMKSFFPATEYSKYQHLKTRLHYFNEELKESQKNFFKNLDFSTNPMSLVGPMLGPVRDISSEQMLEESRKIFDTLKSFEEKEGYHSSKINIKYETIQVHPDVQVSIATAVPPLGYICKKCGSSDHFRDVCTKGPQGINLDYGANKLKKFVLSDQPEEKDLTNLYLKVFLQK